MTAAPVTKTVSVPFEVSPSITSKHDVPSQLEVALGNTTKVTAASADNNTIIHIVPTAPTNSTPAVAEKGLHYSNAGNGTQVCLDDQTLLEVNETEKLVKIRPFALIPSAAPLLLKEKLVGSANEPAKLPSQQTGVVTVPSVTTAALIATKSFGSLAGCAFSGWNATSRTLLRQNIVGSVNEPAELPSRQTGVNDKLLTRPGTASFLAAPSSSLNVTNNKGTGQLESVVVAPTIKSVVVSRTKNRDGTALTLPSPVATASDATAQTKLVIACRLHHELPLFLQMLTLLSGREKFSRYSSVELAISTCSSFPDKLVRTE